ncbi:MAG: hypothetical protein B9S26_08700 [Opitutia bacterium Tous-C4FEB]|nr:MAG: hypothetical protein B9S26_08700 [Opitutae bacterium Tous-C4FEB]
MKSFARCVLFGFVAFVPGHAAEKSADPVREATRVWLASLPAALKAELTHHGLVAEEVRRWKPRGANQGVAVDGKHFYGIGNYVVGKYDKVTGERVAEWVGLRGGATVHLNGGLIQDGQLVLAHSNFPQLPMASSLEYFDPASVRPVKSVSLGIRHGSLTWAEKKDGFWWACFAHYNDQGTAPGTDNRSTMVGKFDENWQLLESWLFPPQVVASWGKSSCSGGSWGDDGLLYTTGHDASELYVLRLPKMGVTLEYVTMIKVPFEGQSWAWDRTDRRVIYGIIRRTGEVVVAKIPELPAVLR